MSLPSSSPGFHYPWRSLVLSYFCDAFFLFFLIANECLLICIFIPIFPPKSQKSINLHGYKTVLDSYRFINSLLINNLLIPPWFPNCLNMIFTKLLINISRCYLYTQLFIVPMAWPWDRTFRIETFQNHHVYILWYRNVLDLTKLCHENCFLIKF